MIYADNAATTQLAPEALAAMMPYLQNEYGNASQQYSFARKPKKALQEARETISSCINASPEEIFFTSGGTESDNWALKGTMFAYGDNRALITSQIEHHAILNSAAAIESMGYPVVYLPVDSSGTVCPDTLRQYITDHTKLVSIMLSNNEIGTIEPIKELATIAHEHGALFHTDAVQSVGHIPIDVEELGVDMLSASAHKFNGPKGIGFLYIRKGCNINPYANGGAQEFGFRAGTENIAAIVGMATALKINCDNLYTAEQHLLHLEQTLVGQLNDSNLSFIRNGSKKHVPGNINISFKNANGEMLLHRLDLKGICISTGSACDSKNTHLSHVISAIRVPPDYAEGTIRISLGYTNTLEDCSTITESIIKILSN